MAGEKALGLLKRGIEVRQPFHDRRPRHDDEARIGARPKHERLALADDARHVGLRSVRDSDWLTKCANMVNGWLMIILPRDSGEGGPPCAAGWWKGRGTRRVTSDSRNVSAARLRMFSDGNDAASPAPPPPRFARCASSSGPPPPLRGGGWCERSRSRDARAPEACRPKPQILSPQTK